MILLSNRSDKAEELKNNVLQLAKRILGYTVIAPEDKFNSTHFVEYFKKHYNDEGTWFLKRSDDENGAVVKGLIGLFSVTPEQRSQILNAFVYDSTITEEINKGETFTFTPLDPELVKVAKDFLEPFYTNIYNGVGFHDFANAASESITRKSFLKSYGEQNKPRRKICPACLGPLQNMDNRRLEDIDHYFPKHLYPTLAMFSDNLIPTCGNCNSRLKLKKDPLKQKHPNDVNLLYLPYVRAALDDLAVGFKIEGGKRKALLKAKNKCTITQKRIENLEMLYEIGEQWSNRLGIINRNIISNLAVRLSETFNEEDLKQELINQLKVAEWNGINTPDAFLMGYYLRWLLRNPKLASDGVKKRREKRATS